MSEETNPYATPQAAPAPAPVSTAGVNFTNLASRWARLGGAILDSLIVAVPALGIMFMLGLFDRMDDQGRMSIGDTLLSTVIGIACYMAINGALIYKSGQTVGKRILGTQVVNLDGTKVDGNRYVVRRLLPFWLIPQIPIIGGIIGLANALCVFRREKNCLHDDIAQTRVVKVPKGI
ncbi:MAG: RDD family protein [Verrucomicrobiota bacterium]